MMQRPICWKIAQPWWHSFPIWVICSTMLPHCSFVPTGSDSKSIPGDNQIFAKGALCHLSTLGFEPFNGFMAEQAHLAVPGAGVGIALQPVVSTTRAWWTFCLAVPFSGLMQTAMIFPIRPLPFFDKCTVLVYSSF